MADINSIPNFPKGIGPVDNGKSGAAQPQQPNTQGANFQNQFLQALGQISQGADQVAESPPVSYENVQQAMDQAKNAFNDTMQANEMMQHFLMNSIQKQGDSEPASDEEGEK